MTKKEVTQLSYEVVGIAIKIHKALGPGLLESVYERCMIYELEKQGYQVKSQIPIKIKYEEIEINSELKIDILVNDIIIVELKTVEKVLPVYEAQLMTYMKLLQKPQGLLINFYTDNITGSMIPVVNEFFKKLPD
jgi:GxxExxY protein